MSVPRLRPDKKLMFFLHVCAGLDPAGPGFHGSNPPSRPLSRTDATNVVVFVTDGTAYGMPNPDATTIYLNGGGISPQPMCEDLYLDVFGKNERYRVVVLGLHSVPNIHKTAHHRRVLDCAGERCLIPVTHI